MLGELIGNYCNADTSKYQKLASLPTGERLAKILTRIEPQITPREVRVISWEVQLFGFVLGIANLLKITG